jgi:uncharacterized membrane protein YobD (UPF0266 family)
MNYLNITKYIYLVIAGVMVYDSISKWNQEPKPWLSVMLAALAIFVFFFRNKFAKKFEQNKKQQNKKDI